MLKVIKTMLIHIILLIIHNSMKNKFHNFIFLIINDIQDMVIYIKYAYI